MFFIRFPAGAPVEKGVLAFVNGERVMVKRDGNNLTYKNGHGELQVCQILAIDSSDKLVSYTCASHGQDPAECEISDPLA